MRFILTILLLALPVAARAQDVSVNGLADFGLVVPPTPTAWTKGGLGKLDYGGGNGGPPIANQAIADLRLDLDPSVSLLTTGRAAPYQHAPFDVLEAYGKVKAVSTPEWLWTFKVGAFFPPISLENESVGWTSPWTLTPSAINSWVGDELRTIGGQTDVEWRYDGGRIGLTGAVFGWNDPAGALLADRGWAFDSRPVGLLGEPRMPDALATAIGLTPPLREEPFKEIGGQPGWYAGGSIRQDGLGKLSALYYDNRADPGQYIGNDFGWRTKFTSLGLETDIGDVVLLSQAMFGKTTIEPFEGFYSTTNFQSAYLLAGYYFGDFRIAGRFDVFATQQHSDPGGSGPGEHGHALTLSGSWTPVHWLRFSTELLHVDSYRTQRIAAGLSPRASELQLQFLGRIYF